MLQCMKTKLITHGLLLLGLTLPITGCFQNDGTVVGKYPISYFYDDLQMQKLAAAAARGDVKAIDQMVSKGAEVNRPGKEGMTPLLWAFGAHNEKGFLRLLEHGANPNAPIDHGGSVMNLAVTDKNPAFLKMALEHGGDPNWTDPQNGRPIIFSTINPYYREPIKLLIAAGSDLNIRDKGFPFHNTPLHTAASLNQYDIVYMLLKAGADYTLTNSNGRTMVEYLQNPRVSKDFKLYPWRIKSIEWLREHGVEVAPEN
jgi:ankyrin repeat protein